MNALAKYAGMMASEPPAGAPLYSGMQAFLNFNPMVEIGIPEWTEEVLGTRMTPDEFAHNKRAQRDVMASKLSQYLGGMNG